MKRIHRFAVVGAVCLAASCAPGTQTTSTTRTSTTSAAASHDDFDRGIERVLAAWGIPGAAVAVTHHGRLVVARGYGHPRLDTSEHTSPLTRFRIASLTKPITSVAIHLLHQEGRLDLDASVMTLLALEPPAPDTFDARWRAITVRHLLEHSGGFDRMATFDPMFANEAYAKMFDRAIRPDDLDFINEVMLQRPLDFAPGSTQAYSNYGYALLGRVIERVTGETYEGYVRRAVLAPMGITRMEIGHERPQDRPGDEAFYFPDRTDVFRPNLFTAEHELVSPADGGFFMRPMEAHGGFIASSVDYARFLVHVDGEPNPTDILTDEERASMLARPSAPDARDAQDFYAHGFDVIPTRRGTIWSHTGAKPGTTSVAVRLPDDICYVILVNARPLEGDFTEEIDVAVLDAIDAIETWPDTDLFPAFGLPPSAPER